VKILIYSPAFLPLVGGLELNTAGLALEMARQAHLVTIITTTPSPQSDGDEAFKPVNVIRNPPPGTLIRWFRWSDVILFQNISLRGMWPLLVAPRPWVSAHHSWYRRTDGDIAWPDRIKRMLARRPGRSIAVSHAVARDLGDVPVVIENAYRDDLFRRLPAGRRYKELLFVGRLVSDKGVDHLIEALASLRKEGANLRLTVVGDGPERQALERQAADSGLQVEFLGTRTDETLVRLMNEHQILVVPSRYDEPFGTVALEGIACGCLVVASRGGGLVDAVGPCGLTFKNGDPEDLARTLRAAVAAVNRGEPDTKLLEEHLDRHKAPAVASRYLAVLRGAVASTSVKPARDSGA
jgi:glycogen(starch) synthase